LGLLHFQTFKNNKWLIDLQKLGNQSHIMLTPQKLIIENRVKINNSYSSVEFNQYAVSFSEEVRILGSKINPLTKLPYNQENLQVEKIINCEFIVENLNINILVFIEFTISKTQEMSNAFSEFILGLFFHFLLLLIKSIILKGEFL
jgi:hypothetical protein